MKLILWPLHGQFRFICFVFLTATFFSIPINTFGQSEVSGADAATIEKYLSNVKGSGIDEKSAAYKKASEVLVKYGDENADIRSARNLLESESRRLAVFGDRFNELLDSVNKPAGDTSRNNDLRLLRDHLLWPAIRSMEIIAADGITAEEAVTILKFAKAVSQTVDDLADTRPFPERGRLTGSTSAITRFLTVAKGILEFTQLADDPDAEKTMRVLRDTVGQISLKAGRLGVKIPNPMQAFETPAAVVASQLEQLRQGADACTTSVDLVGQLIDGGDQNVQQQLLRSVADVEQKLSSESFAKAMRDALVERLIAKLPFLRHLSLGLSGEYPSACRLERLGRWRDFEIVADAGVNEGKFTLRSTTIDPLGNKIEKDMGWGLFYRYLPGEGSGLSTGWRVALPAKAGRYNVEIGAVQPPVVCPRLKFEAGLMYHLTVDQTFAGVVSFEVPEESEPYIINLISVYGELASSLVVWPDAVRLSQTERESRARRRSHYLRPGTYKVIFPDPIVRSLLRGSKYETVEITAKQITRISLPRLRCKEFLELSGASRKECWVVR